jgi:hypothetical protein
MNADLRFCRLSPAGDESTASLPFSGNSLWRLVLLIALVALLLRYAWRASRSECALRESNI